MARRAVALVLSALPAACSPDAGSIRWEVAFEAPSLAVAAARLELEVRREGCEADGAIVYDASLVPGAAAPEVPDLDAGAHAFVARAIDASCARIGEGCAELVLPADGALVETLVSALSTPIAACPAAECRGGVCTTPDAGRDAAISGDAPGVDSSRTDGGPCVPSCTDATLVSCDGGVPSTSTCLLGCAPDGTARCARVRPSNVADPTLLDPGALDVTVDAALGIDTTACAAPREVALLLPGGEACAWRVGALSVTDTGSIRLTGTRPFVLLASGPVAIDGRVDASAYAEQPGAGGFDAAGGGMPGAATMGGRSTGGGGNCGRGGGGGAGGTSGGVGAGPAIPRQLRGGSGGGRSTAISAAGAGGGAVQITSAVSIEVDGEVTAGGGGGRGSDAAPRESGGSGGGAGGTVVLEAPTVTVGSSGRVDAFGGGGGGGGHDASGSPAGRVGGDGREGGGGGAPASGGGAGGRGATTLNGDPGEPPPVTCCGGGGGGGAGFVHLVATSPPGTGPAPGPRTGECYRPAPLDLR